VRIGSGEKRLHDHFSFFGKIFSWPSRHRCPPSGYDTFDIDATYGEDSFCQVTYKFAQVQETIGGARHDRTAVGGGMRNGRERGSASAQM
jgi:hypothetical protein